MEVGRASSINRGQQRREGRVGNIEETKERGLDRRLAGDIATGAIWQRLVDAPTYGG